jgi:hypothetical protein
MRIAALILMAISCYAADADFNGRWDITVPGDQRARAWWLEVDGAGTPSMKGRFVGAPGGQMDPIQQIAIENGELVFTVRKGTYRARLDHGKLQGTFGSLAWTGVRAPAIDDRDDASLKPGKPIDLFNGKVLSGWHSRLEGRDIGWRVTDGILNNANAVVPDLVSDASFWNYTLHVEYKIGPHSNSGIGLRGRYEIQIYDDFGQPPSLHGNGALYSRIAPRTNASRKPGEWQTFDIRLVGRTVTIVLNDRTIIDHQQIEGLTAIANNPNEGEPGPIILQGDHGPVEFRKIVMTPLAGR